ncbi:acyl carrier protein [Actinoallomurus sp. NPDC050550]|uniref:acyl carrier protein n=1 Tax=Actinoallomurus sp. NPDC050550 TaxID=3154937 RepID=UPI0033E5C691
MTPDEAQQMIEEVLAEIVPGTDLAELGTDSDLRESLELDSLDFLSFVEALSDRCGRRIEEDDYPRLATIEDGVTFLTEAD